MTHTLQLTGCGPVPLSHYLKALGILRLVAEQVDHKAKGWWSGNIFLLESVLDRQALYRFFEESYRPTPIANPWSGGSGFYPKDNKSALVALRSSTSARFAMLKQVLDVAQSRVADFGLVESPKDREKYRFLQTLRASLPDEALVWLDAAILMTGEELRFPPLLGTGGNDGRLDFSNNFLQRVVSLLATDRAGATADGLRFLPNALFGEAVSLLSSGIIGQFSPGDVGGPNATSGFVGGPLSNPWDFVFMIEGALTFAAAATRRLQGAGGATMAFPFTVYPTGAGSGQAALTDEGPARAEMWLPLWSKPAAYGEVRALFAEGRATVGRRVSRDGLDFARAVAALGVDRGIEAFQRYGFFMRFGLAYLATPLTRMKVKRNQTADLIQDLDRGGWLSRLQRLAGADKSPNRLRLRVAGLQEALFTLTRDGTPVAVQAVLVALGHIHHYLAHSPGGQENLPPVPCLSPQWFMAADDHGHEFRLAAALASLHGPGLPMRAHLYPFDRRYWQWAKEKSHLAVWQQGPLLANLLAVLERRFQEQQRHGLPEKPWQGFLGADLAAVAAFLAGSVDDQRIADLLAGLVLVATPEQGLPRRQIKPEPLPLAYLFLKPLWVMDNLLHRFGFLPGERSLPIPAAIIPRLRAGQVDAALQSGWQRLRASGVTLPSGKRPQGITPTGHRLAGGLLIPLAHGGVASICRRLAPQPQLLSSELSSNQVGDSHDR